MAREIFYHGSSQRFDEFDMSHALEGDGKVKFGYGAYVTSNFATAALYAGKSNHSGHYYVYTVEVAEKKADNFISHRYPVEASLLEKVEGKLGKVTKEKYLENAGKSFRKYIALALSGKHIPDNPENAKPSVAEEKAASEFLLNLGIDFIEWPQGAWKKPWKQTNRAILDEKSIKILKIEEVELAPKGKKGTLELIEGSQKTIFEAK